MLEDKDIQRIIEAATEVFATREEIDQRFSEMRQDFSNLQTAVDRYAKKADAYFQEMVALTHKVDRLEKWVLRIAKKIGMKLEY